MCELCAAGFYREAPPGRPPAPKGFQPRQTRSTYPVDPFWRRAVELNDQGHTWKELAERCNLHPDQFTRSCGLRPTDGKLQERVQRKTATRLARGLGLDLPDAGF